jgi:hypothetical protein
MTIIEQVGTYLDDNGVGSLGQTIFLGNMPDQPDSCIAVIETVGLAPSIDIPTSKPGFQVLVRSVDYDDGYNTTKAIKRLLHQFMNDTLVGDGDYFFSIFLVSDGGSIGRDSNGREIFSTNFICYVRG